MARELRAHPDVTIEWLSGIGDRLCLATIGVASTYIGPYAAIVERVPGAVWLSAVESVEGQPSSDVVRRVNAYILAIAFRSGNDTSRELVVKLFEPVHDVLMDRDLAYEEWMWLSEQVPSIGWSANWDRGATATSPHREVRRPQLAA